MRVPLAELAGGDGVCVDSDAVEAVCGDVVEAATGALSTGGIEGVAIVTDDDAISPSCVLPVGVDAVGAADALTLVSCPLEPTLDSSVVFVCSVVIVWV